MNSVKSVKSDKWVAAILVRPVGTNLGAEITGVDLTRPLDAKTVAAIADAKEGREKLRYFEKYIRIVALWSVSRWEVTARSATARPLIQRNCAAI